MKKLPWLILLVALLSSLAFLPAPPQNGDEPVNGPKGTTSLYKGIPIFIMTTPVNTYQVVGESRPDEKETSESNKILVAVDEALSKVSKGKMPAFNGVIVHGILKKMEFVSFSGNDLNTNAECYPYIFDESKKEGVKYVYFCAKPNQSFRTISEFDKSWGGSSGIGLANNTGDPMVVKIRAYCTKAFKEMKEKTDPWNALIISQSDAGTLMPNEFGQNIRIVQFNP